MTERPTWHYSVALWIVHGLIDGLVTVGAVALLESTTVESNPLLRTHLHAALYEFGYPPYSYTPFLKPLLLKFAVAGVASLLLLAVARIVPRRVFVGFSLTLTASGVIVVLNNLVALRGLAA